MNKEMKNIPKKIYLCIGDEINIEDVKDFDELHEVLWSAEGVNNNDIEYTLDNEWDLLQEDKWISVSKELKRAEKLHPDYPDDMFRQVAIINEEAGEVTKAVLHYHYENGSLDNIKKELIQTMAMCMRMLESLPKTLKEQEK